MCIDLVPVALRIKTATIILRIELGPKSSDPKRRERTKMLRHENEFEVPWQPDITALRLLFFRYRRYLCKIRPTVPSHTSSL